MCRAAACFGCLLLGPAAAFASPDLTAALRKMSRRLEAQYPGAGVERPSLAVFPLDSNERLMKQRVGFALSELLTHEFVQSGRFTVVERSELLRVLQEQRLQQTGAIDPASAVRVGKLVGANLAVLGSIEEAGGKYLVNARLVRIEDGTVLGTDFEEVGRDEFEETARPYLAPVPKAQSVGFYFGYRYQAGKTASAVGVPATTQGFSLVRDVSGQTVPLSAVVVGMRYDPFEHVVVDMAGIVPLANPAYASFVDHPGPASFPGAYTQSLSRQYSLRAMVGWRQGVAKRLSATAALGAVDYVVHYMGVHEMSQASAASVHPTAHVAVEFRPQPRFGVGLGAEYDLTQAAPNLDSTTLKVNRWSLEPTVSINF